MKRKVKVFAVMAAVILSLFQVPAVDSHAENAISFVRNASMAHVQTYGDTAGTITNVEGYETLNLGTTGQAKRLESICIKINNNTGYAGDITYRVHVQTYGWLGWAKNGESAGTEGLAKRLEAIQIALVKKGNAAPAKTYNNVTSASGKSCISGSVMANCQHNWVTIVDREAYDEPIYEEQTTYEDVTMWSDGTICDHIWSCSERNAWCARHCTRCYPNCPDPDPRGWCALYNNFDTCITHTETVQVGTKHHVAVTHQECSICGAKK